MKKNASLLAGLAVVLTVLGISNLPRDSSQSQPTAEAARRNKAAAKSLTTAAVPYSPCKEIQERLQPFMPNTRETLQQKWRLPDFCYADKKNAANYPELKSHGLDFVIALVPNPVATHLPLSFDRIIEIIQQAAQDNSYSYDSSWLPWNDPREYSHLSDQLAAQESEDFQERQPGVLVFRNPSLKRTDAPYKGGLAVFVVSEVPTGGINQEQFDHALGWIEQLGGLAPERGLKILGPSFSGSLPSLDRALRFPRLEQFRNKHSIHVASGSVSSESSYGRFKDRLGDDGLGTFDTFMEGDCFAVNRFIEYIRLQHYRTEQIAVLSEDETAFGRGAGEMPNPRNASNKVCTDTSGLVHLYYPRDIATLRSAYEKQSIFSSAKQTGNQNSVSTTLRGDLSEPANSEHDTVRSYGGELTPLAQETVLLAITNVLREKKSQFVILRSTNSLDQIFLSQFLRRALPEARVVIDGSDLLFRRGAEGASLRGVMILSTYPLLTWQQDWTSSSPLENGGSYRIFGEDNAEGLYIAARTLLENNESRVGIANYAPPKWARSAEKEEQNDRPAVWLTVIGHRQFWPVAALNSFALKSKLVDSILPTSFARNNDLIGRSGELRLMDLMPLEFLILLVLCLSSSFVHLLWCARGSISPLPSPFRLAYFAPVPRWQHPVLIAFGSMIVAATGATLAANSGLLKLELRGWNGVINAALILPIFLFAYSACARNYGLPTMTNEAFTDSDSTVARRLSAASVLLLVAAFGWLHWELVGKLIIANCVPTFWRSVHVFSGVSPLVPQLFLMAGMYCWFWFCLRGLALFGNDRPLLPELHDLALPDGSRIMPMFSREAAQVPVEDCSIPIGKFYLKSLVLILPIVVAVGALVLREFCVRTIGEHRFGVFIFFWLALCITMILADTGQSWAIWSRLRVLLIYLDRLPLRRTLNALQGLSWRSVWAMSGNVLAERYCLVSRQIEAMRHLGNLAGCWVPDNTTDTKNRDELLKKIRKCQQEKIPKLVRWYEDLNGQNATSMLPLRDLQQELASVAACVLRVILIPAWQLETDSLIFDRSGERNVEVENAKGPAISPSVPSYVLAAEEFFVLPYVGVIQNVLGRVRALVLGSLFLFVASTLAVSSYPFDPLPMLGGIFLTVFIITGATMIVIYAGMHRDATLSYITGTRPGELGLEFWQQLVTFGAGPLIGLLTTLFPSITDFAASWLQPSSQVMK